jgi:hypothetical protein
VVIYDERQGNIGLRVDSGEYIHLALAKASLDG